MPLHTASGSIIYDRTSLAVANAAHEGAATRCWWSPAVNPPAKRSAPRQAFGSRAPGDFANEESNAPRSGADCEKYRDRPDEEVSGERDRHNCRMAKLRRRQSNGEDFPSSVRSALS